MLERFILRQCLPATIKNLPVTFISAPIKQFPPTLTPHKRLH
jgi:hypothetical protein